MAKHEETRYPLRGAHRAVPCAGCHLSEDRNEPARFAFRFASIECRACHRDPHMGEVDVFVKSGGCQSCHSEDTWRTVAFDHSRTAFALDGRHAGVECLKCHEAKTTGGTRTAVTFRGAPKTCERCHPDVHEAQFASASGSTQCARCHTPRQWSADLFDHTTQAEFVLDGAHRNVPCGRCHPTVSEGERRWVKYKPLETACVSCHDIRRSPEGSQGS
jgi:hypothetical protein